MVGQANNQVFSLGPAHEQRCAHMIFERMFVRSKQTHARVGNLPKKPTIRDKIKPLGSQRVGPESGQPKLTRFEYLIVPCGTRKCQSQHGLLHSKE